MNLLSSLNPRERILVVGGAVILVGLMVWRFGWQPIQTERAALNTDIARYIALSNLAESATAQRRSGGARFGTAPEGRAPLAQRVTRSADAAGVVLARIEPRGEQLALVVQEADFRDLLSWIVSLESREGVSATALEIDRQTVPGIVSARLTVEALQ